MSYFISTLIRPVYQLTKHSNILVFLSKSSKRPNINIHQSPTKKKKNIHQSLPPPPLTPSHNPSSSSSIGPWSPWPTIQRWKRLTVEINYGVRFGFVRWWEPWAVAVGEIVGEERARDASPYAQSEIGIHHCHRNKPTIRAQKEHTIG